MKHLLHFFSWRSCFVLTISILPFLIFFSFYGLYTNNFYFLRIDNYIFPVLAIVHYMFLHTLWKASKGQVSENRSVRNFEFVMYGIYLIYLFKFTETIYILLSYFDYSELIIPPTFIPVGFTILGLQLLLLVITGLTFQHRKIHVGIYNFDRINDI
jgi:hypothetical protein